MKSQLKPSVSVITLITATISPSASQKLCKTVQPLKDFDIASWTSAKWYSHQQRESPYQSEVFFYCVTAEYSFLDPTIPEQAAGLANGFTIKVLNKGQDAEGNKTASDDPTQELGQVPSGLCAGQGVFADDIDSQLTVGSCVLPAASKRSSAYWVLAYDEKGGFGLIAGGQTDVPNNDGSGLCTYSNPFSGLWIFSRSSARNETMIEKYRNIAMEHGIDPSMMKDVSQGNCIYENPVTSSPVTKSPKKQRKKAKKISKGMKSNSSKAAKKNQA